MMVMISDGTKNTSAVKLMVPTVPEAAKVTVPMDEPFLLMVNTAEAVAARVVRSGACSPRQFDVDEIMTNLT
jgi:hypothetical protein